MSAQRFTTPSGWTVERWDDDTCWLVTPTGGRFPLESVGDLADAVTAYVTYPPRSGFGTRRQHEALYTHMRERAEAVTGDLTEAYRAARAAARDAYEAARADPDGDDWRARQAEQYEP